MSSSRSPGLLRGANVAALALTVLVNALASTGVLNGKTTAEISDLYPTLITPAGYTFSIWGIIYTLLLIFVIFQALPTQREKPFLREISFLFVLSSLLNILWLFLWQYEHITLSVIPMFALLATLIAVYLRLEIGKSTVPLREKLCVHLPFSVYLGWITIATIADVAAALVSINWNGLGLDDATWATLVIVIATIITLAVIVTRKDIAYSLVVIWALVGIVVKQSENQSIFLTAGISTIIIVIALAAAILVSRLKR